MQYTTVIRCDGAEYRGIHKNAYRSALIAKKGLKLPKKVHVSMSLMLEDTEIFRSHGMSLKTAFWSFRSNLSKMKSERNIILICNNN